MTANISSPQSPEELIARVFALVGQPARIQILLVIAAQEACVCHLEAVSGMRQASISQHLMVLRKAGLVTPHRLGRNIFYRLAQPGVVQILQQAAALAEIAPQALAGLSQRPVAGCPCPQCSPGLDEKLSCKNPHTTANRTAPSH